MFWKHYKYERVSDEVHRRTWSDSNHNPGALKKNYKKTYESTMYDLSSNTYINDFGYIIPGVDENNVI